MTKLTPPSAERIALSKEWMRQFETGESFAFYWHWEILLPSGKWVAAITPAGEHNNPYRYTPAPAHPHYAKYIEWTRLVDAGEVAKGWWNVSTWHSVVGTSCYTPEPKWFPDLDYEIRKTDKHPDNAKPSLKLIDWGKVPVGSMTNYGTLLRSQISSTDGRLILVAMNEVTGTVDVADYRVADYRLAQQTKFTYLPAGTPPPVVEGLVFEYEYPAAVFFGNTIKEYARGRTNLHNVPCINAYRVIGLAPGYTDNPKLVH
jgi:hypothetical protein